MAKSCSLGRRVLIINHAPIRQVGILSGGFTYFARKLQKELGIDYVHANELDFKDGRLTGEVSTAHHMFVTLIYIIYPLHGYTLYFASVGFAPRVRCVSRMGRIALPRIVRCAVARAARGIYRTARHARCAAGIVRAIDSEHADEPDSEGTRDARRNAPPSPPLPHIIIKTHRARAQVVGDIVYGNPPPRKNCCVLLCV